RYSRCAVRPDCDLDWQDTGIEGIQRFLGRVYRIVAKQGREMPRVEWQTILMEQPVGPGASREIQRKLHQTIKRVSDDFSGRWHFNTCIAAIMELVNELYGIDDRMAGTAASAVVPVSLLADVQRNLVLLLAPFAPYLAYELWETLG